MRAGQKETALLSAAQLLENFDWQHTALGDRARWAPSLETAIEMCMLCHHPALIAWSDELIQIYNDAYAKLIGANHPVSFGMSGKISWKNQWDTVGPIYESVLRDGKTIESNNQLFAVSPNGKKEQRYFSFSSGPIHAGKKVGGVFVQITEVQEPAQYEAKIRSLRNDQLKSLFLQAPVAVAVLTGFDFVVEVANPRMLEIWGKSADEMVGQPVFSVLTDARNQGFEELLEQVMRTGERRVVAEIPLVLQRDQGPEKLFVKFVYEPLRENDGSISGVMVLVDDITYQVEARQRIAANEERLRLAVQSTKLGTWEYDVTSKVFSTSDECRRIFGIADAEANDYKVFSGCVHPDDRAALAAELDKAKLGDGSYEFTHRIIRHSDRATRWIKTWGRIFLNSEKIAGAYLGTVIDSTDQRIIEETLRRNESRARLAIDAAGLGTYEFDLDRNVFTYSPATIEIFGFADDVKYVFEDFGPRIHPDDQPIRVAAHKNLSLTDSLFYEVRILLPDQQIRWVRVNGVILRSSESKQGVLLGTVQDITKSKEESSHMERKFTDSERRYTRMIGEIEDYAIIYLDLNGVILNWNAGAEKIKLYSEEEATGKHFSIFYFPEDIAAGLPAQLIETARREGKALHEGWRRRKDGTRFWGSIVITLIHDQDGNDAGFSKVTRDLSERKSAEDKMIHYTSELETRNRELEQFAFIASHDLQEPLRKIQTFASLIEENFENQELVKGYFKKINASASRMRDLISATLNYSAVSKEAENFETVDLNQTLSDALSDMEFLIQTRQASIHSDTLPTVHGIRIQLGQVFSNLIGNAIKFSEKPPVVSIAFRKVSKRDLPGYTDFLKADNYFEIAFRDNGIGFDQQYDQKIFQIFQRLHGKQQFEGTGIGLALCKKIMENHSGYVIANGRPGVGAEFLLYFPVR